MIQPHSNQPNTAIERLHREAEDAWAEQEYQKSIQLMERAARKEPGNPSLLLNLARAHGQRYDYSAAKRLLEKAVQISPNRAETLADAAQVCLQFDHVDLALGYLQRATQNDRVSIGTLVTLADMRLRDRRIDEAAELIAHAARLDQTDIRVRLEEAIITRLRGQTADAERLYRDLLANPAISVAVRIRALYDLAALLDAEGQTDAAMAAWLEVKAIQRPQSVPYAAALAHIQNRGREMEETITTEVMDRWRGDASKLLPSRRIALLCGHPRSGTTLLEQVLDSHPDATSAEETKIMHDEAYLPVIRDLPEGTAVLPALDAASPALLGRARENYFRCMELFLRRKIAGRLLIDKNPALNLMIPMVVRVFPETKFIVALRDPRDVILSCFMQALPLTPISAAYISLEETAKNYAGVMRFWLNMRPRLGGQWIEVRYEEMVDNLPSVARSTLHFLGLPYDENVLKFHEHARAKRVNSPSHADVQKPLYRTAVGRWQRYQKYLEPTLPILDPFLKEFGYA